jgi:hypothetical protein
MSNVVRLPSGKWVVRGSSDDTGGGVNPNFGKSAFEISVPTRQSPPVPVSSSPPARFLTSSEIRQNIHLVSDPQIKIEMEKRARELEKQPEKKAGEIIKEARAKNLTLKETRDLAERSSPQAREITRQLSQPPPTKKASLEKVKSKPEWFGAGVEARTLQRQVGVTSVKDQKQYIITRSDVEFKPKLQRVGGVGVSLLPEFSSTEKTKFRMAGSKGLTESDISQKELKSKETIITNFYRDSRGKKYPISQLITLQDLEKQKSDFKLKQAEKKIDAKTQQLLGKIKDRPILSKISPIVKGKGEIQKFSAGVIQETKEKPLTQIQAVGLGATGGLVYTALREKAKSTLTKKIIKKGGQQALRFIPQVNLGITAVEVGVGGIIITKRIKEAKAKTQTSGELGRELTSDLYALLGFGGGAKSGSKLIQVGRKKIALRDIPELKVKGQIREIKVSKKDSANLDFTPPKITKTIKQGQFKADGESKTFKIKQSGIFKGDQSKSRLDILYKPTGKSVSYEIVDLGGVRRVTPIIKGKLQPKKSEFSQIKPMRDLISKTETIARQPLRKTERVSKKKLIRIEETPKILTKEIKFKFDPQTKTFFDSTTKTKTKQAELITINKLTGIKTKLIERPFEPDIKFTIGQNKIQKFDVKLTGKQKPLTKIESKTLDLLAPQPRKTTIFKTIRPDYTQKIVSTEYTTFDGKINILFEKNKIVLPELTPSSMLTSKKAQRFASILQIQQPKQIIKIRPLKIKYSSKPSIQERIAIPKIKTKIISQSLIRQPKLKISIIPLYLQKTKDKKLSLSKITSKITEKSKEDIKPPLTKTLTKIKEKTKHKTLTRTRAVQDSKLKQTFRTKSISTKTTKFKIIPPPIKPPPPKITGGFFIPFSPDYFTKFKSSIPKKRSDEFLRYTPTIERPSKMPRLRLYTGTELR